MTTRTLLPSLSSRHSSLGPAVAGYRLDELIGIGESANVYAGVLDVGGGIPDVAGSSDPVAVKLCLTSGAGAARGGSSGLGRADHEFGRAAECRALALRPIARMPRLLDLATTEGGELVLVMTLCRGRPVQASAPRAAGRAVDAGELARLVRELHEAGVAHGGLDPGAVLVDDDGGHSLVGFRLARFAGDVEFGAAVGADLRAVAMLARGRPALISFSPVPVPVPAAAPAPAPAMAMAVAMASASALARPAMALTPTVGAATSSPGVVSSSSADEALDDAWRWTDDTVEQPGQELAFLETLEPAVLAIRETGAALRGLVRTRSAGAMVPRRRRMLAAGGALVVAAAVAGCLLIPAGGSDAAAAGGAAAGASDTAAVPSEGPPSTTTGDAGAEANQMAIRSDDPVRALSALLASRRECLRAGEPRCLDAVDQWNAPALLADQDLMRGSRPPDDPLASVTAIALVERIGATALLRAEAGDTGSPETTKPVSLLVMRGETGWRLRSYRVGLGPD
jgi:hypothetical protein